MRARFLGSRPGLLVLALALALAAALGLAGRTVRPEGTALPAASAPSRVVILFDVDMLRADRLGTWGYARDTSPRLDGLLERGLVAEHAVASAGWTLPAHASIFASQPVSRHGIRSPFQRVPSAVPLLAEVLTGAGVRCLGVQSGGYVDAGFGFARGFEAYVYSEDSATAKAKAALRLLDQAGPGPVFLFLHVIQVHNFDATERAARAVFGSPAALGPGWAEPFAELLRRRSDLGSARVDAWLSARYDAAIRETDDGFGELLDGLEARGLAGRTALVFTSDHGEEMGERPLRLDGAAPASGHTVPYLYEEHVHVPLGVVAPWRPDLRGRVSSPVSSLDVAPTVLDLLDLPRPVSMAGIPLGTPQPAGRVVVAEAPPYGALALVEGRHKLILRPGFRERHWETGELLDALPAEECFDLDADPGERRPVPCKGPWAEALLLEGERTVADSFPGSLVVRAVPGGAPCRLGVAASGGADVRFFGQPPGARVVRSRGKDRVDLRRLEGPVWIVVDPLGPERALELDVEGCGGMRRADGEALRSEWTGEWASLLWRGERRLPDGSVVFASLPRPAPDVEEAPLPEDLAARLRSLGYVTPRASRHADEQAGKAPGLPPAGDVRIRVAP